MSQQNNVVVHDRKAVFMLPQRCAQSSVKAALTDALRVEVYPGPLDRLDVYLPTISREDVIELKKRDYKVFATCRDPYQRMISCYRGWFSPKIDSRLRDWYQLRPRMSFTEFVDFVASVEDQHADPCFRSMSYDLLTDDGELIPEYLYNVSYSPWWFSFRDDLAEELGLFINLKPMYTNAGGPRPLIDEYFTKATKKTIRERYEEDFDIFDD